MSQLFLFLNQNIFSHLIRIGKAKSNFFFLFFFFFYGLTVIISMTKLHYEQETRLILRTFMYVLGPNPE